MQTFTRAGSETYDTRALGIVDAGGGVSWLFSPRLGVRRGVRDRLGLLEPESLPSMWTCVRTTSGLTVAF